MSRIAYKKDSKQSFLMGIAATLVSVSTLSAVVLGMGMSAAQAAGLA